MFHMDCIELMRTMPDKSIDLCLFDPPYAIGADKPSVKPCVVRQENGTYLPVEAPNYGRKEWDRLLSQEYFDEVFRVSKNQIIFGANYYGLKGGMIVWDKMNGENDQYGCEIAYQSFNQRTDIVHYMWQGMFQGEVCSEDINKALRQQGNKSLNENRIHPCQKPILLYGWLLQRYAKEGDIIFDPMAGSQNCRIAAYRLNMPFIGCEKDEDYYKSGCERFERECLGISKTKSGKTIVEQSLF